MNSFCKIQSAASVLIFVALIFSSSLSPAQGDTAAVGYSAGKQPVYITSRLVTEKPVIDGKLDEECWKHGNWAGDYHQWIPEEGAKPTWPTIFNIQYDDKNIYVAFRGYDGEPEKINRMSGIRDEQVGDMMGITFDSYRDYRTGFEFTMTAWGQKSDLILFNPMDWDFNWDPVWKGKTGLEDSAWVAEMEIPLSQLRFSREDEQVWGMHTWRWISRLQEESNWELQSKTGPGMLYNFGEFRGISGLGKSRRLELMPFVFGDLKTFKKEPGNPFTEDGWTWGGNAGLDAKIGVSSNFTIDLTVNPDFGQVESDPSVMNLTAFETFYEEKRPFFLEGLTIFDYDFDQTDLFYSRRIGHAPSRSIDQNDTLFVDSPDKTTILSSAKFSGTTSKGLSIGLIQSLTAGEYARTIDQYGNKSESKVEPLTNYLVARLQKGYKAGNTVVGGMLTSTNRFFEEEALDFLSNEAFTGGVDLRHHWKDKKYYLDAKLLGSYVGGSTHAITTLQESSARYFQRPGADYLDYDTTLTGLSGFGGKLEIGRGSQGLWKYSSGISWLSPGLELNDLGYMNSADQISQENQVTYFVIKPVSIFNSYEIELEQFNSWNFGGTWLGSGGEVSFLATLKNNWTIRNSLIYHSQAYDPRKLRGGPDMLMPHKFSNSGGMMTDPSKKLMFHMAYGVEVSGDNSARSYDISPSVSIRPFSKLRVRLIADYRRNLDELQYIAERSYNGEKRYILGTIDQQTLGLTLRADLNLTPEFSIQYYGSPFISRGTFSKFKHVNNPQAKEYEDRFTLFTDFQLNGNVYGLDETGDLAADYFIGNPDFNFHQFRSNLVAKWEYRLGSFIYLVWSGERTGNSGLSEASLGDSYKQLSDVFPNNIFLIKLNYWFAL
ncbi:MAG: DUF5916 domain-containing protein [Bacteroidota bacterium]